MGLGIAGAMLGGSILGTTGGAFQTAANMYSANKQMRFQREMSDTAHQRQVADLRAAGLNPILSATGGSGASSPQGASFEAQNPFEDLQSGIRASALIKGELDEQKGRIKLNDQNYKLLMDKRYTEKGLASKLWFQRHLLNKEEDRIDADIDLMKANAQLARANARRTDEDLPPWRILGRGYNSALELAKLGVDYAPAIARYGQKKYGQLLRYVGPGDTYGKGRGTTYGGPHKAR